ncbi:MAG: BMP family ABC transporter substrate-binding protein [Actinomycetaceae bacterium]|nr:BMP family ABC transporter substrate-binding protein [Actinomycetaceae bacterium]
MKNSIKVAAFAAATAMLLGACGSAPEEPTTEGNGETNETAAASTDVKACMVSDEGGFDDKSFNQSGYEGLKRAEAELGVEISTTESSSDADFEPNLNALISDGCDVIIGVGFKMADQLEAKAKENPEVKFALVDSTFAEQPENARALVFNTAEASYLAGYAAAGMTETGKIGTFLGMALPTTQIFADGFEDGMNKYNEENSTDVQLVGWSKEAQDGMATGDFSDVAKGQTFSKQLVDQGVDVIMPVAGPVGAGALAAASENEGVKVVWVDADGYETQPESGQYILTSVVKEIGAAVFDTIKLVVDDAWISEQYVGNLENGGVSIAPFHDFEDQVPQELKDGLENIKQQIVSGEIVVETPNQP